MKRKPHRATRIVALALASLAAPVFALGCGGSAYQPSRDGTAAPPGDPAAALDQAERDVHLALGLYPPADAQAMAQGGAQAQGPQQQPFATAPTAPTAYAPAPPPPNEPTGRSEAEAKRAEGAPGADAAPTPVSADPCATACRALDSMERAATHLCELAGEDNTRCTSAKERLRKAEGLVHQKCPGCAG